MSFWAQLQIVNIFSIFYMLFIISMFVIGNKDSIFVECAVLSKDLTISHLNLFVESKNGMLN